MAREVSGRVALVRALVVGKAVRLQERRDNVAHRDGEADGSANELEIGSSTRQSLARHRDR